MIYFLLTSVAIKLQSKENESDLKILDLYVLERMKMEKRIKISKWRKLDKIKIIIIKWGRKTPKFEKFSIL